MVWPLWFSVRPPTSTWTPTSVWSCPISVTAPNPSRKFIFFTLPSYVLPLSKCSCYILKIYNTDSQQIVTFSYIIHFTCSVIMFVSVCEGAITHTLSLSLHYITVHKTPPGLWYCMMSKWTEEVFIIKWTDLKTCEGHKFNIMGSFGRNHNVRSVFTAISSLQIQILGNFSQEEIHELHLTPMHVLMTAGKHPSSKMKFSSNWLTESHKLAIS